MPARVRLGGRRAPRETDRVEDDAPSRTPRLTRSVRSRSPPARRFGLPRVHGFTDPGTGGPLLTERQCYDAIEPAIDSVRYVMEEVNTMANQPDDSRITLTVEEAAKALGIGRGLAYEAVRRGEIPTIRLGKRLLVPRSRWSSFLLRRGLSPTPLSVCAARASATPAWRARRGQRRPARAARRSEQWRLVSISFAIRATTAVPSIQATTGERGRITSSGRGDGG